MEHNNYYYVDDPSLLAWLRERDRIALEQSECPRCKQRPPTKLLPLGPHIAVCDYCAKEWFGEYDLAKEELEMRDDLYNSATYPARHHLNPSRQLYTERVRELLGPEDDIVLKYL